MSTTLTGVEAPGDAELISAVRGGDVDAYGVLFERHADAARRLARQLVAAGDVDDLVSEAFVKVLTVLQRGGGPDVAFRAYLLTAVRRLRVDRLRATSKLQTTDEIESFDPGVPFRDTVVEGFESEAAARAFASLPERWQLVLWHTEVEGQKPADVAPLLGMSANAVSALAYRAREGLRQAFLTQHVAQLDEDTCRWTHEHLGGYIRDGLSRRDTGKVEAHLQDCRACAAIYLELTEVNSNLAGILAPVLLGGAAAGYLSGAGAITKVGLVGLVDRGRDWIAANTQAAAASGAAAVVTVVAGTLLVVTANDEAPPRAIVPATDAAAPGESDGAGADDADDGNRRDPRGERSSDRLTTVPPGVDPTVTDSTLPDATGAPADDATAPGDSPSDAPGVASGDAPGDGPADSPGDTPGGPSTGPGTDGPTDIPTDDPTDGDGDADGDGDTDGDGDGDEPGEDPPDGPATPPSGPPVADLTLSPIAGSVPNGDRLTLTALNIPGDVAAEIHVTTDGTSLAATLFDASDCNPFTATCRVTAGDPTIEFHIAGRPGTTLTFTIRSAGVTDPDTSNNSARITIN